MSETYSRGSQVGGMAENSWTVCVGVRLRLEEEEERRIDKVWKSHLFAYFERRFRGCWAAKLSEWVSSVVDVAVCSHFRANLTHFARSPGELPPVNCVGGDGFIVIYSGEDVNCAQPPCFGVFTPQANQLP